ncbi:MAG: hypothetical protein Q8876_06350 [Bacillota bacterium]|nr:hypothetical protein [Bacillota bacterium]
MATSKEEMERMQQDAIRRAREMQARAKYAAQYSSGKNTSRDAPRDVNREPGRDVFRDVGYGFQNNSNKKNDSRQKESLHNTPAEKAKHHKSPDILDALFQDKERALLLILILVLSNESADPGLLLALMYLVI